MRPLNEELSRQILSAVKTEFKKGFRNASMRSIAASVGVTTGAIYRYYSNKEALFDALVSHPAEEFFNEYMTYSENFSRQELDVQLATIPQLSEPKSEIEKLMEYIYKHYDAFKLIACCSEGTEYENYADRLTEIKTKSGTVVIDLLKREERMKVDMDSTLVHIISNTIFTGIFEIISHDDNASDAKKHINALYDFYTADRHEILGIG